jgi:hypothetical protein
MNFSETARVMMSGVLWLAAEQPPLLGFATAPEPRLPGKHRAPGKIEKAARWAAAALTAYADRTKMPTPGTVLTRPSERRTANAFSTVA